MVGKILIMDSRWGEGRRKGAYNSGSWRKKVQREGDQWKV